MTMPHMELVNLIQVSFLQPSEALSHQQRAHQLVPAVSRRAMSLFGNITIYI